MFQLRTFSPDEGPEQDEHSGDSPLDDDDDRFPDWN